ncbi:MAG: 3'(2'),5'-bisphosphate nucleotidase [Nitrospiraceae bacterium]|nr:3'(2'),5'-bisphosphate nucleotidase [Nitrospiraceae bacterium]
MLESEGKTALDAVRGACRLTRSAQDRIAASSDRILKEDRSPVTIADLAAQAVITSRLIQAFPEIPIMAEEDTAALTGPGGPMVEAAVLRLAASVSNIKTPSALRSLLSLGTHPGGPQGRFWTLDPIDGTRGFLRGEQYAVALALIEDGDVMLGMVGCPNLPFQPGAPRSSSTSGCIFTAIRGHGAEQWPVGEGAPAPVSVDTVVRPDMGSFCESVEPGHTSHGATARVAARLGITAPPYRVDGQTKYGIVARGEASIYLRLPSRPGYHEKIWDHAAGSILVAEAGGRVTHVDGQPLDFSAGRTLPNATGIVVTNGLLHDAVLEAVQHERKDPDTSSGRNGILKPMKNQNGSLNNDAL